MPTLDTMFPSKYLKADDLRRDDGKGFREFTLQIRSVDLEDMGSSDADEKDQKWVVSFVGAKKGLVLNKTNATTIAETYGDSTDDWLGNKITLFVTTVTAFGQSKPGIRVRVPDLQPFDPDKIQVPV